MSIPELILTAIVAVVGFPSARRNPTSAALVGCWVVTQLIYTITGDGLAVEYYPFLDTVVIAVILAKPEPCNFEIQETWLAEMKCIFLERSVGDRIILCTFPVCWVFYVAPIAPFYVYWALWLIAVAQFLTAGWEAFFKSIQRHAEALTPTPHEEGDMFACPAGGWGVG